MTQLESVQSVAFLRTAQPQTDGPYTADDFVLLDALAENPEYAVRLFYPDKNGLLTPVTTVLACTDPGQLPLLALQRSSARPCRSISAASSRRARR